jgi:hypothetical protein
MKIYRLALIFLATMTFANVNAQSFSELGDAFNDWNWEVMIRRTQVNTKYTIDYGGTTFNMKFRFEDYEKGASRWHFENPTLGDMFWVVARLINGKGMSNKSSDGAEQAFGSGFFGWHQVTWNTVSKDKLLISPGISFGDYIFASRRGSNAGVNSGTLDPAGYFFHAGPSLMVSHTVGNNFWANVYTRYDLTTRAGKPSGDYKPPVDGGKYKNPHFFGLGASLNHANTHLCFSANYTHMIDRGANKDSASRLDVSLGFMF